jgi:uncharacterized protein YndB with AHSA1/START domain
MSNLQLTQVPTAKTGMLIRRPAGDVFEAIVNPVITTKFWFTKSSGHLEVGKPIKWEWEMYNASTQVTAKAIEPNRRILIQWEGYSGPTNVGGSLRRLKMAHSSVSPSPVGRAAGISW